MKKYASYIILIFISMICFQGCDDVIEDDITNDLVSIVAPRDMDEIKGNTVQFRWNGVEGADDYRIQINNQETNAIILDSLVSTSVFDYAMNPGAYQWRVRGENFAYVTAYSFDSEFTVVASTDLANQTVVLTSPANNLFTNNSALTFTWEAISTATFYKIKISKIEGSTETQIFEDNNIDDTSILIGNSVIAEDGKYKWEIQAVNDSSMTDFFPRTFSVDTQAPPKPSLTEPTTGQTASVDEEISFKWSYTDTGAIESGITSTIQIATDQTFDTVIHTNPNPPLAADEYTFTFTTAGTYFWRVRGIDDAENTGDFSEPSQIIIN